MVSVTQSSLLDDSWKILFDHLQTGTYAIATNNIYSAFPDTINITYPVVVIEPPRVSSRIVGMNGSIRHNDVVLNVSVYHNSAENLKTLADDVIHQVINGRSVLHTAGLFNVEIGDTDYDWWREGQKKVHVCNIPVKCSREGAQS